GLMPAQERARGRDALERWRALRPSGHTLHAGAEVLAAIEARFELLGVEEAPYLYRYFASRLERSERGAKVVFQVLEQERAGIAAGTLAPAGLRLAARRR